MMNYDYSVLEKLSSYVADIFNQNDDDIEHNSDISSLKFKLAINYFETLINLFKDNISNYYELFIYNKLGWLYYYWEKPLIAEKMFKQSLINYTNEETDLNIVANNLFALSKIYSEFKEEERSRTFLICSLFVYSKLEDECMLEELENELEKYNITVEEVFENCKDKYWSMF